MKIPTTSAVILAALVAAAVPSASFGQRGIAVRADLKRLEADVKRAHRTLTPDFARIRAAAKARDRARVHAAGAKLARDTRKVLPRLQADRKRLARHLRAATRLKVKGIRAQVRTALRARHRTLRRLSLEARGARLAVRAMSRSLHPG